MPTFTFDAGDWVLMARFLTPLQEGLLIRAVVAYMHRGAPLPRDADAIAKLVGAHTEEDLAALDVILRDVFESHDDGFHLSWCDAQIACVASGACSSAKRLLQARPSVTVPAGGPASAECESPECGTLPGIDVPVSARAIRAQKAAMQNETFEAFWALQPRKIDRMRCREWWRKHVDTLEYATQIIEGARRYLASVDTSDGYRHVKHPRTWLNGRCWEDEGDAAVHSEVDSGPVETTLPDITDYYS